MARLILAAAMLGMAATCQAASPPEVSKPTAPGAPALYERLRPEVVTLIVYGRDGLQTKSGSGVVLSQDGLIATNYHVVEGGTFFDAKLPGDPSTVLPGRPMKCSPELDLAVLQVAAPTPLRPVMTSNALPPIGSRVFAIGSPFQLEGSFSEGVVSQLRKESGQTYIQTTAPISPGSSGGGLFAESGDLVGITTMSITAGQALNFAVPSSSLSQLKPCRSFPSVEVRATGVYLLGVRVGMEKKVARESLAASYYEIEPHPAGEIGEVGETWAVSAGQRAVGGVSFSDKGLVRGAWEYWSPPSKDAKSVFDTVFNSIRATAGFGPTQVTLDVISRVNSTGEAREIWMSLEDGRCVMFTDDFVSVSLGWDCRMSKWH